MESVGQRGGVPSRNGNTGKARSRGVWQAQEGKGAAGGSAQSVELEERAAAKEGFRDRSCGTSCGSGIRGSGKTVVSGAEKLGQRRDLEDTEGRGKDSVGPSENQTASGAGVGR